MLRLTLQKHCGSRFAFEPRDEPGLRSIWNWDVVRILWQRKAWVAILYSIGRCQVCFLVRLSDWLRAKIKTWADEYCSFHLILHSQSSYIFTPTQCYLYYYTVLPNKRSCYWTSPLQPPASPLVIITPPSSQPSWESAMASHCCPSPSAPMSRSHDTLCFISLPSILYGLSACPGKALNHRSYFPAELDYNTPFKISQSQK